MATTGLQVTGMKEFRRELRLAGGSKMTRFVAAGNKAVALEILTKIQVRGRAKYYPRAAAGEIVKGITAVGTQRRAAIRMNRGTNNKRKKSLIFAAEFGTHVHYVFGHGMSALSMKNRVFQPWTGNQFVGVPKAGVGYAVFPVIREEQSNIAATYLSHIEKAFWGAYPERG